MAKVEIFQYELGFSSHKGLEKEINEDNYCVERREDEKGQGMCLVALSDGMGGFSLGEIASKIAINQMEKFFKLGEFKQMFDEDEFLEPPRVIQELYTKVNHIIRSLMEKENRQVGCTLVSGFFYGNEVYVANVGNSRAYLIRKGAIKRITDEVGYDPLAEVEIENPEEGALKEADNRAYVNALGSSITLKADIKRIRAEEDDIFLFCTDGLFTQVSDTDILNLSTENPTMQGFCNALIERANLAGGKDNVTVVVVKIKKEKHSIGALLSSGSKERIYTKPAFIVGLLLAIMFVLGLGLLFKKIVSRKPRAKPLPITDGRKEGHYTTGNSLTLTSNVPIKLLTVNKEPRFMKKNSRTFEFEDDKNEIVIMPDMKKSKARLYVLKLSGFARNLSVKQGRRNKIVLGDEKTTVYLTTGSSIDYEVQRGYYGERFVMKVDKLGSPYTIKMESPESIEVEILPDKDSIIDESSPKKDKEKGGVNSDGLVEKPSGEKGRKFEYKLE